ncbi:AAA domain-containing protein [Candidatus Parcubacteria bacterium]|nr:AAA domain-containing protein [Candidatus Parcubacteria bacterium]
MHKISDIRIYDIKKWLLYVEILNLVENIQSEYSKISNIKLDINVSLERLRSDTVKKDLERIKELRNSLEKLLSIEKDVHFLENFQRKNKGVSEKLFLHVDSDNLNNLQCQLLNYSDEHILAYLKFKEITQKLEKQFNNPPEDKFFDSINAIEEFSAAQMTYFLDKRIIEYTQDYAAEVNTLKSIVRKKQKFPKDLFQNLKKAFPCILAGIRDYAEYIPLEKDLFDLIIIDEASQVSIAQALPALIRGKQIIVLGDDKQFSNVKAGNASKVTNQQYKSKVHAIFSEEWIEGEDRLGWSIKVKENFDIKNSILKFLRFIRNYECQLKKHFRCYPEIISYSDKYFYDNTLQCMKIRGKKIDEVIKIDIIKHDGKLDATKNTNELEADFIISKLKDIHREGVVQSIGIITPHREQVTLLFDKVNEIAQKDWLFEKCKLKIMTFDTCQGEERDYIFYSMVATKEKDRLNWIFLKSFSSIGEESDGTIKSQRMNVGFSRAKECVHFVLSKSIEEFQGEIRNALLHYKNELIIGRKRIHKKLDSEMEYKIDDIFHKTKFYKDNKDSIEFIPQFPIGDYLRQLDKNYTHPAYRTDFLLIFGDDKIVIEYDGFKYHFVNREEVNRSNYEYYMKAEDVYRRKVLEGYGYKFLRINRFNIGKDPIETLNERLENLVKKKPKIQ